MFLIDTVILVSGILILLGIASSKFSARLGLPVLVLFLILGMLAGSEGIGGIVFDDYRLAHAIGSLALAMILFDGGLQTAFTEVRKVWKPALSLATIGVVITAGVTGAAAAWILGIPWLEGMLLGSIVGSTDAAAVFGVLRSGGVHLRKRLASTLEIESASNDPMAIFLTVGTIEILTAQTPMGLGLLSLFVMQMIVGLIVGVALGYATVWAVNRINLDAAGLYPILVTAGGLLTYGIAVVCGGSGFLAVFVAGVVIGNRPMVFQRGIFLFHDAIARLSQIVMFVVLGLLSFPSRLLEVTWQGLAVAAVLTFIARPIAVLLSVFPFRYSWRELTFISWVGLKGAVPITLATFPLVYGVEGAPLLFDVVFFVVIVSAAIQGLTLPMAARHLGVEASPEPQPPVTLEISSLRHVEGDIVDYLVTEDSPAAGRLVRELALPSGVVIAIIAREQQIIPPQGSTRVEAGDHVILVLSPGTRLLVDKVFAAREASDETLPASFEFPLRGSITVRELEEFYGIQMANAPPEFTLDEAVRERLGEQSTIVDAVVNFGPIALHVREVNGRGRIESVGMILLPSGSEGETPAPSPISTGADQHLSSNPPRA